MTKKITDTEQILISINKCNEVVFVYHKNVTLKSIAVHIDDLGEFISKLRQKIIFAREHSTKLNFTKWVEVMA